MKRLLQTMTRLFTIPFVFALAACDDLPAPVPFPAAPNTVGVSVGPDLANHRFAHASVTLNNGNVLVCGGLDEYKTNGGIATSVALESCEIFDHTLGKWGDGFDMVQARLGHELVVYPDGTVLAIGGQHGFNYLDSAEIINPAGMTSTLVAEGMAHRRINFTATFLPGPMHVLVAGGISDIVPESEFFQYVQTWKSTGPMGHTRSAHRAVPLPDGTVLIAGGDTQLDMDPIAERLQSAEIYQPETNEWVEAGDMRIARSGHTMTALPEQNRVIVTGGFTATEAKDEEWPVNTVELFDSTSKPIGNWMDGPSMIRPRVHHAAVLLHGGRRLLVTGGLTENGVYQDEAEILDVKTGLWKSLGKFPMLARRYHSMHLLPDGRVLIFGGRDGSPTPLKSTLIFTPPCASNLECAAGYYCAVEGVCARLAGQSN